MPYTNIHHPSNTHTTVTIVLSIIFGVSIIPSTAFGALHYTLENADVPKLYQEVKLKIQSDGTDANFKFEAGDKVYIYIPKNINFVGLGHQITPGQCEAPTAGVTFWEVTVASDGTFAEATVIITKREFRVGQKYDVCYQKAGAPGSVLVAYKVKPPSVNNEAVPFTVDTGIFTTQDVAPSTVYAGQDPVVLSFHVQGDRRRVIDAGENRRPYLIPCPTGSCSKDDITPLCSRNDNTDTITTGVVTGFGTGKLSTTFTAPLKPAASYRVCVPYCFKAGSCGSIISWALVDSDTLITFEPANPSVYTLNPNPPQADTWTEITFAGTQLNQRDRIRIIPQGQLCSSASPPTVPNMEYNEYVTTNEDNPIRSVSRLRFNGVLSTAVAIQVCYSRYSGNLDAESNVWAPVSQTTKLTDATINPLQTKAKEANKPKDDTGGKPDTRTDGKKPGEVLPQPPKDGDPKGKEVESSGKKPVVATGGAQDKPDAPKADTPTNKDGKPATVGKVSPKVNITVPLMPNVNKSTTLSATAISSTIPAVLVTSVVFLYLYNW